MTFINSVPVNIVIHCNACYRKINPSPKVMALSANINQPNHRSRLVALLRNADVKSECFVIVYFLPRFNDGRFNIRRNSVVPPIRVFAVQHTY